MHTDATTLLNRLLSRGKFRHIQVLLALVELGSVQRAADTIGLTQSSVTQTLAYLEELLQVKLFERHARGVQPTVACLDLLPAARQLMHGLTGSAEAITARRKQGEGVVRLLASAAAIHGILVDALPAFAVRRPELLISVTEAEGQEQLQVIARDEVDIAVCRRRPVFPDQWEFLPLCEDRMVVVCRPDNALAKSRAPNLKELAEQTWLLLPAGTAARSQFDALAAKFPTAPRTYPVVTRSLSLVWELLRQKDLLALLPMTIVRARLDAKMLIELNFDVDVNLEPIGILRPKSKVGPAAMDLCHFLSAFAEGKSTQPN